MPVTSIGIPNNKRKSSIESSHAEKEISVVLILHSFRKPVHLKLNKQVISLPAYSRQILCCVHLKR